ncbi:MAG: hypothetical protein JWM88_2040 [Verrucomicrobia bacterium]|nr:hypothetical protein [Verrucomicrobiota bacterium]
MKPPPLPEETLRRVLRASKINGWSVLVISLPGALISGLLGDFSGAFVGLIVAYGGWTEVSGHNQVRRGDADGMQRLVRAQWIVLGAVLVYCVTRIASFDADTALSSLTPGLRSELASSGVDVEAIMPMVRLFFYFTYGIAAFLTLIYQGGMARYYRRREPVVRQALADRLRPVVPPAAPSRSAPEDLVT